MRGCEAEVWFKLSLRVSRNLPPLPNGDPRCARGHPAVPCVGQGQHTTAAPPLWAGQRAGPDPVMGRVSALTTTISQGTAAAAGAGGAPGSRRTLAGTAPGRIATATDWGGIIGVSSKANTVGPENGLRMERTQPSAPHPSGGVWGRGPWPGAHWSSTLPLPPLPLCPPLLLHQRRKCSTDLHIFPNIRDLFFFPLWEETDKNPRRGEAGGMRRARENWEAFAKAPANTEHEQK